MILTDLPVETIDQITAALDTHIDLKILGAAYSLFRLPVASAHHFSLWNQLSINRSLAQNVRILVIQSAELHRHSKDATLDEPMFPAMYTDLEVPEVHLVDNVDSEGTEDEDDISNMKARDAAKKAAGLEAERVLVSALKGMSGLISFRWTRTPPLINPDQKDDIWMKLAKTCSALNSVDVSERPFECAGQS